MRFFSLPNSLSVSRIVLAPPTMWALLQDRAVLTVGLFCIVIASDLADGRIARQRQQISHLGTLLDHGSDAVFVTVLCAAGAWLALLPIALPILIPCAFLQYAFDSRGFGGGEPRGSQLGHWNGIAYFVIVGALIGVHHFGDHEILKGVLHGFGWLLVATTFVSIVGRALHVKRAPRAS